MIKFLAPGDKSIMFQLQFNFITNIIKKKRVFSEAHKRNLSESHKGIPLSDAHKQALRKPKSEAARLNMSLVRIGKKRVPFSEMHRLNISKARKGIPLSESVRLNMSKAHKGVPLSEAHKKALSEAHKGVSFSEERKKTLRGKKHTPYSEAARLKMSLAHKGKQLGINNPSWKGGITILTTKIRNLPEFQQWRKQVFERDKYICQDCFKQSGALNAHHIKEWNIIFRKFLALYNQFSPIDDKETLMRLAINYAPFWELSNGKTVCKECHKKYKKKIQKEVV